jgi:ATP-dependent DNA ligase
MPFQVSSRLSSASRLMNLCSMVKQSPATLDGLRISERFDGDGRDLFRHACALKLGGIVSKRTNTAYHSGRFDGWREIKCPGYERRSDGSSSLG